MFCFSSSPNYKLPKEYKLLKVVGEGGFGTVLECVKKDTQRTVAVKIPKFYESESEEVPLLERLMHLGLNKKNIVKFFGSFQMNCGKALVFEMLDISLWDYILDCPRLQLKDIRTIIRQLATAFDALKKIGVIHTDVKPDNIMMVNHKKRPFKVKLIDFGLAISSSKARQGMTMQTPEHRAPEIILGLPFSEAIDMWALGCVMATMIMKKLPFPGLNEYHTLQFIHELLGQAADHLLDNGLKTYRYFDRTDSNSWRLKKISGYSRLPDKGYKLQSLDDLKKTKLKKMNSILAKEQSIELLKAMLRIDPSERITPSEVLTHPFITRDYQSSHNEASTSAAAHCSTMKDKTRINETMEKMASSNECFDYEPPATILKNISSINFSSVIMIQPANRKRAYSLPTHMNNTSESFLDSIHENLHCEPSATAPKDDDTSPIKPDHCSAPTPMPTSGVQPAIAEDTQDDQKRAYSLPTHMNNTSESFLDSIHENLHCEPSATAPKHDDTSPIKPDHCSAPTTMPTSGVQPAIAEDTQDDRERTDSLQAGLNKTSVNVAETIPEDFTTCDDIGNKRKKKKNCFRRMFSWMKKTLRSCWTSEDDN